MPGDNQAEQPPIGPDAEFSKEPSAPLFASFFLLLGQLVWTVFEYLESDKHPHNSFGVIRQFEGLYISPSFHSSLAEFALMFVLCTHLFRSFVGLNFLSNDATYKNVLESTRETHPKKVKLEWILRLTLIVDQGLYVAALKQGDSEWFLSAFSFQAVALALYQYMFKDELYKKDRDRKMNLFIFCNDMLFILYSAALITASLFTDVSAILILFTCVLYPIMFGVECFTAYRQSLITEVKRFKQFFSNPQTVLAKPRE